MNSMGIMVEVIKKLYRALLPTSVRDSPMVAKLKTQLLGHDLIYNADYYEKTVEGPAARSAGRIANSILNDFKATCVIDVGCGTGALLEALRDKGCEVFGLEYAEAALRYCRARRLNVAKFDLERNVFHDNRTFDVAVSMEVAEHLPETVADRYVGLLTQLSRVVVFTAAPPGQGGADHINEQPPSYWITKFQQRGFEYAEELSQRWREIWRAAGNVESWYYKNLMIFRR
jgi:SAM-dependent methyltransferase